MTTHLPHYFQWNSKTKFDPALLLERDEIILDDQQIRESITGRRILITGAAGSIGSELARQISFYKPDELILLDNSESGLVELESTLRFIYGDAPRMRFQFCNINDKKLVKQIFDDTTPHTVYHAAALKHVPFVENNIYYGIKTNILGTEILARISIKTGVKKFVFVSSDKAVQPGGSMGATKRFAEKMVAGMQPKSPENTQFIIARFGNVLGSNGSVVNVFQKQIDKRAVVTITDPNMERFFMTPFEAGQLLLESGASGTHGQIFVLKIGTPIRIVDLANKMIRQNGFVPYKEIAIEFTGTRPGEKLSEILIGKNEHQEASHQPQISIVCSEEAGSFNTTTKYVAKFKEAVKGRDTFKLATTLRSAVPELSLPASLHITE